MASTSQTGKRQVIQLRSKARECVPLPGNVWAIGTTLGADRGRLYFFIDYRRWLVQLRLSALGYRRTFFILFGTDERQLAEWFRHRQWPRVPWFEVAQGEVISAASKAGLISDPRDLGFEAGGSAVVARPLDRPTIRTV